MDGNNKSSPTSPSRPSWAALLALTCLAAGLVAVADVAAPPRAEASVTTTPLRTRDIGSVPVACSGEVFVASLNTDDDNENGTPDRGEAVSRQENNLREFVFDVPEATRVYIAEVALIPSNEIAVGKRVRAYEADKRTGFTFGDREVPVTMHLEGKQPSQNANDIGFEYQYFRDDGSTVCGGFVQGTIVRADASLEVASGQGTPFSEHHKMLITGIGDASATVAPANLVAPEWSYDAAGATFTTPTELATRYTAPETFTPPDQMGQDRLRLILTATATNPADQVIEANVPVNVTAPRSLELRTNDGVCRDNPPLKENRSGLLDTTVRRNGHPVRFTLFNWSQDTRSCVAYNLLDQEGGRIKDSAYARRRPQVKENIGSVLTSPIPAIQQQIANELEHSPDWVGKPDGILRDGLRAFGWPKSLIVDNGLFHRVLRSEGGVLMQVAPPDTHIWELSVRGPNDVAYGIVAGTNNMFSSVVDHVEGQGRQQQINILSRYRVVLP